jgi:hypothetical protein
MRRLRLPLAVLGLLAVVVWVVPRLVRQPLARWLERAVKDDLHGYALRLDAAELRPLRLGVRLHGVVVQDEDGSEPPIARAPVVDAGLRFAGFRPGAWATIRKPTIALDDARLREIRRVRLDQQLRASGRRAVRRLERFGAALDEVRVESGRMVWRAPAGDVALTGLRVLLRNDGGGRAGGIDDRFGLVVAGRVGETGSLHAVGRTAPFLGETPPLVLGFDARRLPLTAATVGLAELRVRSGTVSARGRLRVARRTIDVRLREAAVRDADVDYRRTADSWSAERVRLGRAAARLRALTRGWSTALRAGPVVVERTTVGLSDPARQPPYRLFLVIDRAQLEGVDTGRAAPARLTLAGRPMGSGTLDLDATATTDDGGTEVVCRMDIRDVRLTALNDALRAHGATPLASGRFAFALDASVRDGRIAGYAKPLFEDVALQENPQAGVARRMAEAAVPASRTCSRTRARWSPRAPPCPAPSTIRTRACGRRWSDC